MMSIAEILAELPKLNAEDRAQLFQRLCQLQEEDLFSGIGPSADEKRILDEAGEEFQRDDNPGIPWRDALRMIRQ